MDCLSESPILQDLETSVLEDGEGYTLSPTGEKFLTLDQAVGKNEARLVKLI